MKPDKKYNSFSAKIVFTTVLALIITIILGVLSVKNIRHSQYLERVNTANMLMEKISFNISAAVDFNWSQVHSVRNQMADRSYETDSQVIEDLAEFNKTTESEYWLIDSNGWIVRADESSAKWSDPSQLVRHEELFLTGNYLVGFDSKTRVYNVTPFSQSIVTEKREYTHLIKVNDLSDLDAYFDVSSYGDQSFAFLLRKNGAQMYRPKRKNPLSGVYNVLTALQNAEFAYDGSLEKINQDIADGVNDTVKLKYDGKPYFVSYSNLEIEDIVAVVFIPEKSIGGGRSNFMFSIVLSIGLISLSLMTLLLLLAIYLITGKSRRAERLAMEAEHRANQAKTDFLSSMSHDIRTPMNAIVGMAEIATIHAEDPDYVQDCVRKIRSASTHLLTLINDILDISKIESGQMVLSYADFSLSEMIDNLLTIVQPQVDEKNLHLTVRRHNITHDCLNGDKLRLNQICINLLSNAVKYTEEGGSVEVDFYEEKQAEELLSLRYVVCDTGIGMTEEFQRTMFRSFTRAVDSRVNTVAGSGLGLTIVRQMVRLMGGSITCKSQIGVGTTFEVQIPFRIGNSVAETLTVPSDSRKPSVQNLRNLHLLVAEDNDLNWEVISDILEMNGIFVERAVNGLVCVEMLEAAPKKAYSAILMDIRMPVMNGYEATRRIRSSAKEWVRTIPIIAVTADAFAEDVQACMDAGMNAHVARPIDFDELFEKLSVVTSAGRKATTIKKYQGI